MLGGRAGLHPGCNFFEPVKQSKNILAVLQDERAEADAQIQISFVSVLVAFHRSSQVRRVIITCLRVHIVHNM